MSIAVIGIVPDLCTAVSHCSHLCHAESSPVVVQGPEHLGISLSRVCGGVLVRLVGELDIAGVQVLTAVLSRCDERTGALMVDAAGLTFIDAAGIRPLVDAQAVCRRQGRDFRLAAASAAVRRVVTLTGLEDRLFGTP